MWIHQNMFSFWAAASSFSVLEPTFISFTSSFWGQLESAHVYVPPPPFSLWCGLQAALTPSNRPSCITFSLHHHCSNTIFHLCPSLFAINLHQHWLFLSFCTHNISSTHNHCMPLILFHCPPNILPPFPWAPFPGPLTGRGHAAFVCDRGRSWDGVRYSGFVPSCEVKIIP